MPAPMIEEFLRTRSGRDVQGPSPTATEWLQRVQSLPYRGPGRPNPYEIMGAVPQEMIYPPEPGPMRLPELPPMPGEKMGKGGGFGEPGVGPGLPPTGMGATTRTKGWQDVSRPPPAYLPTTPIPAGAGFAERRPHWTELFRMRT